MTNIKLKAKAELELRNRLNKKLSNFYNFLQSEKPEFEWDLTYLIYMRKYLERIANGEKLKVMFFLPPQHGKSTQNTIYFTSYYLLKKPEKNVILGAYNSDFASEFSIQIREIVGQYKNLSIEKANRWKISKEGGLRAGGVGSGITGYPADLVVIDDPIKTPEEAYSATYRNRMWHWWLSVVVARMHVNTSCIFTMTRWHLDDLAARILDKDDEWEVVSIPAIAKENDVLGRIKGDALWESKFPKEFLLKKRYLDENSFESLYQQNPVAAEGSIIKRIDIQYYEPDLANLGRLDYILQSWDTAFKDGEQNDYSAMTTWGCVGNKIYLLDTWRGKLEYPDLKDQFELSAAKWKPNAIIVEDKASGQSISQDLQRTSKWSVLPQKVNGDKLVRCRAVYPQIKSGIVLFPKDKEWMSDYINELCTFPAAAHDDWVDSTTQALLYLKDNYSLEVSEYDFSNFHQVVTM